MTDTLPLMAVVLVAASGANSVRRTLWHLRQQTVASQLEVVVVAESRADVSDVTADVNEFAKFSVVEVGKIGARGEAAARGIEHSRAPLVGLVEDHAFPAPNWAAQLIDAHQGDCAAAGPAMTNANPHSAFSRANFLITYSMYGTDLPGGSTTLLPWHNSVYKRAALKPFESQLAALLSWEGTLQASILAAGGKLYFAPQAVTEHANVSRALSSIGLHFQRGRILGVKQADRRGWGRARRALHAVAFPLFPLLQWRHMSGNHNQARRALRPLDGFAVALALAAMAVGEAWGLVRGTGDALVRLEDFELRRVRHIAGRDAREIMQFAAPHTVPGTQR